MGEHEFWDLIGTLDWSKAGDDTAVCAPLVNALTERSVEDIAAFDEWLARALFALDTKAHAREIGEEAYVGPEEFFSVDWFLYVRCCVVANGLAFYETALKDPSKMPEDLEFESLLYVARTAHERKTGESLESTTSVSFETFSNEAGWNPS